MSKENLNGKDIGNEHFSNKGGHFKRSTYWKNLDAIKTAEDEAWEFAEKMIEVRNKERKEVTNNG